MVDVNVVQRSLVALEEYINDLLEVKNEINWDVFSTDKVIRRYVERTLHMAVEACLDITNHIISYEGYREPRDNKDSFEILNIGDNYSQLNWQIESYPSWGTWSFEPESGYGLTPEQGSAIINVSVIVPDEPNTQYNGSIKIINIDDPSDYEIITVKLETPVNYNLVIQKNSLFLHFLKIHKQIKDKTFKLLNIIKNI